MTYETMKEKIALYMTGDLPLRDVSNLERHLENCATCQTYREEMTDQLHQLLRLQDLHTPAMDRNAILNAVAETSPEPMRWCVPAMIASMAAVLLLIAMGLRSKPDAIVPLEFHLTQATQFIDPQPAPQSRLTQTAGAPEENVSVMVKLYTDDPNVLIHWFGD